MVDTNSPEWEIHYSNAVRRSRRRLEQMLDRFGESLQGWLTAALNWPREDWEADLADFLAHSRMTGIELSDESLGQIRGLIEAQVNGTTVFAEYVDGGEEREKHPIELAAITLAPGSGSDAGVDLSSSPRPTYVDGLEVAGPGPETTASFQEKVRFVLNKLDPAVARWWTSPSVDGLVQSRNAWGPKSDAKSSVLNGRPVMVVDKSYTAGQTAEAIISHAGSGLFPDSLGVAFRRDKYGRTGDLDVILEWRRSAVGEAAEYAAMMAELYYGTLGGYRRVAIWF